MKELLREIAAGKWTPDSSFKTMDYNNGSFPIKPSETRPGWVRKSPGVFTMIFDFSSVRDERCMQHFCVTLIELIQKRALSCPLRFAITDQQCQVWIGEESQEFETGLEREACQIVNDIFVDAIDSYNSEMTLRWQNEF